MQSSYNFSGNQETHLNIGNKFPVFLEYRDNFTRIRDIGTILREFGTSGHRGRNRGSPDEIGTVGMFGIRIYISLGLYNVVLFNRINGSNMRGI